MSFHQTSKILFLITLLASTAGTIIYRKIIEFSGVFDFYIADTLPNSCGLICANFLFLWQLKNKHLKSILWMPIWTGASFIVYEILQWVLPWQTFDLKDIVASLLMIPILTGINYFLYRYTKNALADKLSS